MNSTMSTTPREYIERAKWFVKYFERLHEDDPDSQDWQVGFDTSRQWLGLIERGPVPPLEARRFTASIQPGDFGSAWIDLRMWINKWVNGLENEATG